MWSIIYTRYIKFWINLKNNFLFNIAMEWSIIFELSEDKFCQCFVSIFFPTCKDGVATLSVIFQFANWYASTWYARHAIYIIMT
jgi:hypothetical protein